MSKASALVLVLSCAVLSFGSGTAATFAFRPKPAEAPKPLELPKAFRGERFEVVDAAGKVRAWLGVGSDGASEVVAADAEGRAGAVMTVRADGVVVVEARAASGTPVAALSASSDGAQLGIGGGTSPVASLISNTTGDARLEFLAPDRTPRASFAPAKEGYALTLRDSEGVRQTVVGVKGITAPEVRIPDAEGKVRARLGLDKEHGAELALLAESGAVRARVDAGGRFQAGDEEGKVRASLDASAAAGGAVRLADAEGAVRATLEAGPAGLPKLEMADAAAAVQVRLEVRENGTPSLSLWDAASSTIRAWLDISASGSTQLGLYDTTGKLRAMTGIDDASIPYVKLLTAEAKIRACLFAEDGGDVGLDFRDAENRSILALRTTADMRPSLSMADSAFVARIWLGLNDDDWTLLSLTDPKGNTRCQSGVRPDSSAYVSLRDAEGDARLLLDGDTDGRPSLLMYDDAGKLRTGLYLATGGESSQLRFSDPSGNERAWLGYDVSGGVSLNFYDSSKRLRAAIGTPAEGEPSVSLLDTNRVRLSLALTTTHLPVLHMTDSSGKDRVQLGLLETEAGRINVLDGSDGVIWNAP